MAKPKGTITIEQIIELKERNPSMSLREAGKLLGCTGGNIATRLKTAGMKWGELSDNLEQFKSKRGDKLASLQQRVLSKLTDDVLKKSSAQQLVTIFGILYDKERIERGKATDDRQLYVVLIERSFKQNFMEGKAKIIDAEAIEDKDTPKRHDLITSQSTSKEKDK